jgi:hypothetical protein
MSTRKKQIRQEMFNEFSVNLATYSNPRISESFACPICLRLFNSIDALSDAHIFPKALGGRSITLTCTDCNNNIGSSIESYETERVKPILDKSWSVSLRPLESSCDKICGNIPAKMKIIDEQNLILAFDCISKKATPNALNKIEENWGKAGFSFQMEFKARADWHRAKLTYLHSAFLYLFSQFGYEWALDPCTQAIREQLQKPEEDLISFEIGELTNLELADFPRNLELLSLYLIREPEESKGFLVIFSGLEHWNSPIGVWMPLFGCSYKLPEFSRLRVVSLPTFSTTFSNHLSTFNYWYLGHRLVQHFFPESN